MSLDSQQKEMLSYAAQHGLEVSRILLESQSAKSEGRPVFATLLAAIQAGEADAVLCWKVDRLARNMADSGRLIDLLQRGVIKQIRTYDALHLPSDNVLMLAVQLGMANQYSRDLSENVKRGNRTKLEQGGWPNRAPFGYKNDVASKELTINPKQRLHVARAFELYATGQYTILSVCRQMNLEGFRTASGTPIANSLVERIIKNPFYMGVMYSNGKYYPGNHKPIVSTALYDQAQHVLAESTRPKTQHLLFPLRGLLTCASCSCMYTASLKKGHQYYYCTNGKGICKAHKKYMRSEPATALIAEALSNVRFDMELIEIMYEAARERGQDQSSYNDANRRRLESLLTSIERQELVTLRASADELLSPTAFAQNMRQLKRSRMIIEKDLADLAKRESLPTLEPTKKAFIQASTALERFLAAEPEQQKQVASEVLWNLTIKDGEIEQAGYKSFYKTLAEAPKKASLETLLAE